MLELARTLEKEYSRRPEIELRDKDNNDGICDNEIDIDNMDQGSPVVADKWKVNLCVCICIRIRICICTCTCTCVRCVYVYIPWIPVLQSSL